METTNYELPRAVIVYFHGYGAYSGKVGYIAKLFAQ
jgi:hypothetical protein